MIVLYFTATGNSLYVAKKIGGELHSIPKLIKEGKFEFEDEAIGLVFPLYYTGVPKLVEEFLKNAKLKSKYIFGVVTYGAYSGAATRHLFEIGKRNGIEFSYVNEIVMVDNFLPGFDMKKQLESLPKKNVEEKLKKITGDINSGRKYINKHPAITTLFRLMFEKTYNYKFQKKFYVEENCNNCKVCEKVCPVNNIIVEKTPVFNNNCQQCLACIQNCPQKAIRHKSEKSRARFLNENISLKEMIDSNCAL